MEISTNKTTLLRRYGSLVHAIGATFGPSCEVVLHTLEDYDHAVIAIHNGHVTGRAEGAPITDMAMQLVKDRGWDEQGIVANYRSTGKNGHTLKSTTIVIHDDEGEPIALLCINFDVSAPAKTVLEGLFHTKSTNHTSNGASQEHFPPTSQDLITLSLHAAREVVAHERRLSPVERNRRIVGELAERGIFEIKSSVDAVAEDLGISRYTVYNYIRDVRGRN